jgi:transcriptional regulator with XRE-family HTH domain
MALVAKSAERAEKNPDLVALGARIRELRLEAGLTQEGVADAADLHWTFVGQVERGERNVSYVNLLRLAAGLSVAARELLP